MKKLFAACIFISYGLFASDSLGYQKVKPAKRARESSSESPRKRARTSPKSPWDFLPNNEFGRRAKDFLEDQGISTDSALKIVTEGFSEDMDDGTFQIWTELAGTFFRSSSGGSSMQKYFVRSYQGR